MTFTEALLYIKNYVHFHVMLRYQYHTKAMIKWMEKYPKEMHRQKDGFSRCHVSKYRHRFWDVWQYSLLWTNCRNGRVTVLGILILWLQSINRLIWIKLGSSQILHIISSINRILTLWKCISWTISLTIFATLEPVECRHQTPKESNDGYWTSVPTIELSWGRLSDFVNESPNKDAVVSRAEFKCCKTLSQRWDASHQSTYQVDHEKSMTRKCDPWWLCQVVCSAKRVATESHSLVIEELCWLHRPCRSQCILLSSHWCQMHIVQSSSSSGNVFSMQLKGSWYRLFNWAYKVETVSAKQKWCNHFQDGDWSR
jgi:hypothetical protein